MIYEVLKDQVLKDMWRVEAIDYENEGTAYIALFLEPQAERRARQYAGLMAALPETRPAKGNA